jgi:dinuclear metal center YbgI/SA1388 family protein
MALPLERVVEYLESLAPLALAEPWDNVGLLLEPLADRRDASQAPRIERVIFTIDLTEAVLAEAIAGEFDLVVAYHPLLWKPRQRLTRATAAERVVLRAVRAGLAVYSPHTALDAAENGLNDWLSLAAGAGTRRPLVPTTSSAAGPGAGGGRGVTLARPAPLALLVERLKTHLGRAALRVAATPAHRDGAPLQRIAFCAGSGRGIFERAPGFDLYVTGELPHHDVQALLASGSSVVLGEHSSSERGFLPAFADRLRQACGEAVETLVARSDREPLEVW